jgi:hypothetical protein
MTRDRGAVLVEYALVLGLLLVGSFGTIQVLEQRSDDEVNHQADCISTRPPPPSCQPRTVTTPPPTIVPPITTTTQPQITAKVTFLNPRTEDLSPPDGRWDAVVDASLQVDGPPPSPFAGAIVRVKATIVTPANPTPFFIDCVTALDGTCELRFTTPAPGVTELTFEFETVEVFTGTVTPVGLPWTYTHP